MGAVQVNACLLYVGVVTQEGILEGDGRRFHRRTVGPKLQDDPLFDES